MKIVIPFNFGALKMTDTTTTPEVVTATETAVNTATADVAATVASGTVEAVASEVDGAVNTAVDAADTAVTTAVDTTVHLSIINELETKVRAIGGDIEAFFSKVVADAKALVAKL